MNRSIEDFIVAHIAERRGMDPAQIAPDADLFEHGYIDSLGVFNMIMTLEDEFGIRFTEQDLINPAVNTVKGLTALIASKSARRA